DWLGFNPATTSETRRTIQLAGRTRTLFAQKPDPDGYPVLPPEPLPFDRQYYTDWLAALVHLIEGNTDFEDGQTFDPEQNARLGQLLDNLNPAAFAQDK
ncbi:virulence factor SrfC family protein, partial [uncultured Bilophila sp.]